MVFAIQESCHSSYVLSSRLECEFWTFRWVKLLRIKSVDFAKKQTDSKSCQIKRKTIAGDLVGLGRDG